MTEDLYRNVAIAILLGLFALALFAYTRSKKKKKTKTDGSGSTTSPVHTDWCPPYGAYPRSGVCVKAKCARDVPNPNTGAPMWTLTTQDSNNDDWLPDCAGLSGFSRETWGGGPYGGYCARDSITPNFTSMPDPLEHFSDSACTKPVN